MAQKAGTPRGTTGAQHRFRTQHRRLLIQRLTAMVNDLEARAERRRGRPRLTAPSVPDVHYLRGAPNRGHVMARPAHVAPRPLDSYNETFVAEDHRTTDG